MKQRSPSSQNILAVDTSSQVLTIALRRGEEGLFETNIEGRPRHSEQLFGAIEHALDVLKLKKNELHEFLWGLGPGSFTGLRIGFSALKGLHLGLKKKSFGVSSLDAIAMNCSLINERLAVCVDARRDRIYTSFYCFQNGSMKRAGKEALHSFDSLSRLIDHNTVLTGDALVRYGDKFQKRFGQQVVHLDPKYWYPRAAGIIQVRLGHKSWCTPLTIRNMLPRYLRQSEAEERKNA